MPGLDRQVLDFVDVDQAFSRIQKDSRTDLVVAPHYDLVYERGAAQLWAAVRQLLSSGRYKPDLPIELNVPKPRGFNRPGGILHPADRVVYQILADTLAPSIEQNLDRDRVYSNVLLDPDLDGDMFAPHSDTYSAFQRRLLELCDEVEFFVKLDVANYYENLPQHIVINMLRSEPANASAINLLEIILLAFRENSSRGLIQGLAPSDLLGNFYLSSFDAQCEIDNITSIRFVDDIYIAAGDYTRARQRLTWAIGNLRRDGLQLNEGKSGIRESDTVRIDESAVNDAFIEAVNSIDESGVRRLIEDGYGFRVVVGPADLEDVEVDLAVEAIRRLLADEPPRMRAKIDKFIFPILTAVQNDMGIDRALRGIVSRPYLAQIYAVYLSRFAEEEAVIEHIADLLLKEPRLGNYETMLLIAVLLEATALARPTVNHLLRLLLDATRVEPVRALAGIVACKFGTAAQRRTIRTRYEDEGSPYMRAALLYASQFMSAGDRSTCRRVWGAHSTVNGIIAASLAAG